MDACRYYVSTTNRRITFEWALIRNQTDTPGMLLLYYPHCIPDTTPTVTLILFLL